MGGFHWQSQGKPREGESMGEVFGSPGQRPEKWWALCIAFCSSPAQTPASTAPPRRKHKTLHLAGTSGSAHL